MRPQAGLRTVRSMENTSLAENSKGLQRESRKIFSGGITPSKIYKATWIVVSLLVTLVWTPGLVRSFWVDEAGTYWMTHNGPIAAIRSTWHWPGQSVLYAFIASFFTMHSGPIREFVLRVPTLIGITAAAYFLYRLAESAIGKDAGTIAAIVFLFHPTTFQLGIQARPYGLAMAAVTASCWTLYEWVETRHRRFLLGYIVASALVIYLQYFFAVVFIAHIAYLLYVFVIEHRGWRWREIMAVYLAVAALVTPLLPHMRLLLREKNSLVYVAPPTIYELGDTFLTSFIVWGFFLAALLVQFFLPESSRRPRALARSFFVLLLFWWLAAPVLFFAASVTSPMRIFVDRYMASSIPAQALLIGYAGYAVFGALAGRVWVLLAVLLTTASPMAILAGRNPGFRELMPFMRIIRQESISKTPPVFFPSGVSEGSFQDWRSGLREDSHLFAPFVAYPMKNKLLPLPHKLNEDAKRYVSQELQTELATETEVLFVGMDDDPAFSRWMIARMKDAGFDDTVKRTNLYHIIIFKRAPAQKPL